MNEAIFHPEAQEELRQSIKFYDSRLNGLGLRFLEAVEGTVERMFSSLDAGSPLDNGFRRSVVSGFPYSVIYRPWEDSIYLVAVAHHHRRDLGGPGQGPAPEPVTDPPAATTPAPERVFPGPCQP